MWSLELKPLRDMSVRVFGILFLEGKLFARQTLLEKCLFFFTLSVSYTGKVDNNCTA